MSSRVSVRLELVGVLVFALLLGAGVWRMRLADAEMLELRIELESTRRHHTSVCRHLGFRIESMSDTIMRSQSFETYRIRVELFMNQLEFLIPLFQICAPGPDDGALAERIIKDIRSEPLILTPLVEPHGKLKQALRDLNVIVPVEQ